MTEPMPMPPPEKKQEVLEMKPTKSKGERFFDRAVYVGIAGFGTFFTTIYIDYKLRHGSWGKGRYADVVKWIEEKLGQFLSPKLSNTIADEGMRTTSLMMGGNAMLVPVGIAEHFKVAIVSGINIATGDKTPPETIEQSPKQTWRSLIDGRLLAWGTVFTTLFSASMLLPKSFATFKAEVAQHVYNATQWIKRKPRIVEGMEKTMSYRVGEIAAFDVFATAAAATILYIGGHFFARKQEEKKELRDARREERQHVALGEVLDGAETSNDTKNPTVIISNERAVDGTLDRPFQNLGK